MESHTPVTHVTSLFIGQNKSHGYANFKESGKAQFCPVPILWILCNEGDVDFTLLFPRVVANTTGKRVQGLFQP